MAEDAARAGSSFTLVGTVQHQQRVILTRIGAGQPLRQAYQSDRWADGYAKSGVLNYRHVNQQVWLALLAAVFDDDPTPVRLAAAKITFDLVRLRVREWAIREIGTRPDQVPRPAAEMKHWVYLLYDEIDRLLYVGITDRGPTRLAEHYRRKPWFPEVVRVAFERYATRPESEAREKHLIQSRHPLHNVVYNGRVGAKRTPAQTPGDVTAAAGGVTG